LSVQEQIDELFVFYNILTAEVNQLQQNVQTFATNSLTWTNAQLKAGTPLTIVPAQGPGFVVIISGIYLRMNYGGTNVFTNSPAINIDYNGILSASLAIDVNVFWQSAANTVSVNEGPNMASLLSNFDNQPVILNLTAALTGNAAGDNTVTVIAEYQVIGL